MHSGIQPYYKCINKLMCLSLSLCCVPSMFLLKSQLCQTMNSALLVSFFRESNHDTESQSVFSFPWSGGYDLWLLCPVHRAAHRVAAWSDTYKGKCSLCKDLRTSSFFIIIIFFFTFSVIQPFFHVGAVLKIC